MIVASKIINHIKLLVKRVNSEVVFKALFVIFVSMHRLKIIANNRGDCDMQNDEKKTQAVRSLPMQTALGIFLPVNESDDESPEHVPAFDSPGRVITLADKFRIRKKRIKRKGGTK